MAADLSKRYYVPTNVLKTEVSNSNTVSRLTQIPDNFLDLAAYIDQWASSISAVSFGNGTAAAPSGNFTNSPTTGFYRAAADVVGISTAGVGQVTFADGVFAPVTTNDIDLGTTTLYFKALYVAAINGGTGAAVSTGGSVTITSGAGGSTSGTSGTVVIASAAETGADLSGNVSVATGTTASANSGTLTVRTGAVATSGNSGAYTAGSGNSTTTGNSGTVAFTSGNAATGDSGTVTVSSGAATTGSSGSVTVSTGTGTTATGNISITTGAATTTGGNITITPGAGTTPGKLIFARPAIKKCASSAAINTSATATAAEVATGRITSTSAAAVTLTLPTGTDLGTALGAAAGTTFDLIVDNTAGANTVTVAAGANNIASAWNVYQDVGGAPLDVVSGVTGTAVFRFVFSSATACTFCRIA